MVGASDPHEAVGDLVDVDLSASASPATENWKFGTDTAGVFGFPVVERLFPLAMNLYVSELLEFSMMPVAT